MRNFLLTLFLGACAICNLEAASYDFSYVNGVEEYLGIQTAETYDVAVYFPGDLFEGFRIKEINAQVNANNGVASYENASLWLSESIELKGNKFTPDVASYQEEIQNNGLISTVLPESYVIPSSGVYVGYTITVAGLNNATKFPMGCAPCSNSNAFYCRTNKTMPEWSNLAEDMGYGCAMSFVLESEELPAQSVSIYNITDPVYMELNKPVNINMELVSFASEPVKSVDIDYTIEGKDYSYHYDLLEAVPAGINKAFDVNFELPSFDYKFNGEYTFTVSKVNGKNNESKKMQKSTQIAVFSNVPVHQTLIEEYTGTWCGWCPGGYAMLEYIKKNEPDFVVAAFHDNDPMQVTYAYPSNVTGFPSIFLDRYYMVDPLQGLGIHSGKDALVQDVKSLNAEPTPWGIELSHSWKDENTLVANAKAWNLLGYENGQNKIAYLLVADGLKGTSTSWAQNNNYSSRNPSSNYVEELNEFCRGGEYGKSKVVGLVFNDVVISTNGIYGVAGSLPNSLEPEAIATHSFEFDLSKIKSALLPDRNKLRIIAAVLDSNGVVVNCAKDEINDAVVDGVDEIGCSDMPVEYYDLNGNKVSNPSNGIFIRRQGSSTSKVVIK